MTIPLSSLRDRLSSSFWFVPVLMMIGAAVLAYGAVVIDEAGYASRLRAFRWLITTDLDGGRILLSAIASSMIGVAGVVFSITVVVLSVATGQLGPRLLRSFMRQNTIQISLGTYVATFLFCLLLLIRLQVVEQEQFTPHLSVTLAVAFAVVCLVVLVSYVHHVAVFIQADTVISAVSRELTETIETMFPSPVGPLATDRADRPQKPGPLKGGRSRPILASTEGYIQRVEVDTLVGVARDRDLLVALRCRTGGFVIGGTSLAEVQPQGRVDDDTAKRINAAIVVGRHPTTHEDVEFAIRQLVEVAVRALSPGINDPFTAIACIDQLTAALGKLLGRTLPARDHYDADERLRVITQPVQFPDLLDTAFNQIRQNARRAFSVSVRLLDAIGLLAPLAQRDEDRAALSRHAAEVYVACRTETFSTSDRDDLQARYRAVMDILPPPPSSTPVVAGSS